MDYKRTECWSAGVVEYCNTPTPRPSITPLPHYSITPRFVHSLTLRLAGRLLIGAALLAMTMTGCGPSSDKAGKQSGTNAAAPRVLAKTNPAPALRPGVITNLVPATSLAAT